MQDEAVPRAASGLGAAGEDALRELRYGWGEAYRIGWDPQRKWHARRRDGNGGEITAKTADELWAAVFADYSARPVARDRSGPLAD